MELYRVLLVDDEEDIRVGISRKMDWEGLGFTLVGEAENGRDALELAETLEPDLVLTDIKMPFMDGLELCRILTERLPASKFVVFSGFDDFEYGGADERVRIHSKAHQRRGAVGCAAEAEGAAGRGTDRAPEYGAAAQPVRGEPARPAGAVLHRAAGGPPPRRRGGRAGRLA